MAQDPYRYFRLEARDLLDQFAKGILDLEKSGSGAATVQRLLRLAHTLKGAARVVRQPGMADRAHAIEDVLSPFRDSAGEIPRDCVNAVLQHLDEIDTQLKALTPVDRAPAATQGGPAPDEGARSVRADIAEMDMLLDGVSEAHALLGGLRAVGLQMEQARHLGELLLQQLSPQTGNGARQRLTPGDKAHATAEELRRSIAGLGSRLGSSIDQMDRELRQLRDGVEQLRLISADSLFTALQRTARDIAQAQGKQVMFDGRGGDVRLDAHVLGTIQAALVQIVRNAVAHGIESEAERRAAGKQAAGLVTVQVSRRGKWIVFECRDDGRGLDLEAVRGIALRRGLLPGEATRYGVEELTRLLLRGGISTSAAVTELAGRGVGLDVVRDAVELLGGDITVRTERGKGTSFELVVPLSLASLEALVVAAAGSVAAIPLDAVRSAMRIAAGDIARRSSGASVLYEQQAIPFVSLPRALHDMPPEPGRVWSAVVVAGTDGMAAIGVDRLLGTGRVVVRPMPELASAGAIVAGMSLDAEGNPQLVLDPDGLVAEALREDNGNLDRAAPALPVLVIDDSLTTRMLEQSILESAGYEVDVATSGEEGLEMARRRKYALFLVDVEMPGIDGFTFVERVCADPALHDIPAILVTSRSAPEDRQRGRDAGARGYIVKSEFDQAQLLVMIRPLIG